MSRTLARLLLPAFTVLAFMFLLWPAGQMVARGKGPNSLQPDSSAVFFTMVLQRNQPVSRGNFLILPPPNSHASINAKGGSSGGGGGHKGGGGSGGGTSGGGSGTPCCGTLGFTFAGSGYTASTVETPTTTQPEAEEEIAADPTNASDLVAAISDFSSSSGYNNTKWVLSANGGSTWSESFVPTNTAGYLVTSDGNIWDANSDPVVAFDGSHNVYLSDLYLTIDAYGRITSEGLYVSTNSFTNLQSNRTFATATNPNTYPVLTNINNGSTFNIEDKPWIAVDQSSTGATAGYVYASWSHFTGCQNQYSPLYGTYVLTCSSDSIYFSYSTDHGQKWSAPVQISPGTQDGAVQGSQPAVGPDGAVYVAYEFFGSNNQRQQYLSVGTWSGGTLAFSAPFVVSPVFNELTFAGCSTCTSSYRVNSFPNIAVGPAEPTVNPSGNVYLVYGAQATSTSTAQVNFVACTSNCTGTSSFDGPANLDDAAAGEHFFPAISVAANGVIDTSWFDTRNAPSTVPDPDDYLDIYGSYLTYNGSSFTASPNARITPTTNDASILDGWGDTSFIGDYIGIAATPTGAQPVWTNMAGALGYPTQGSLQTSTVTVPSS